MTNTQKSLLRFALVGGVLTLTLTGCGDRNYETFEECQLQEVQKLSQKSKDLSDGVLGVITNFCIKYPTRIQQEESKKSKEQMVTGAIADPKWKSVNKKHADGTQYFIDANNIVTEGSIKTIWLKELKKGQTTEGNTFRRWQVDVDCTSRTFTHRYYEKVVNGDQKEERTDPWTDTTIAPGSTQARVYNDLCEKN